MIEIISGEKGKGKTKELLNKVNTSITSATGNIVYLDKSQKHMYELDNKVRLVNVADFPISNCDEFLGFICGILDILPYVGTIIVFIPIIIYNIILREYLRVFGLIFLFILVQVVREILEAKFLSDKLDLHPLLILLSIYIGVKIFGMLGIIIGPMYGILAKGIVYSD